MFGRLFAPVLGALLTLLSIGAGPVVWWYDRRPVGAPPPLAVHILWLRWSIGLPPSIAAERDDARRQLGLALGGEVKLQTAIAARNRALQAQAARGARALAVSDGAIQRYGRAAQTADTRARRLAAPIADGGPCARVEAEDARFLETLR